MHRLPRLAALCLALGTAPAGAATLTVTNANDSGTGSLRAAIQAANAASDFDTIVFAVGTGPVTINLATPLPALGFPAAIDGWTQPGATAPAVRIDGAATTSGNLISLSASACTANTCFVRGLVLTNGKADGIRINSGSWTVQGNYIGTDGTTDLGMVGDGIEGSTGGNRIGGSAASERNVIAGNGGFGILLGSTIGGASGSDNLMVGNYIGTNAAGTAAIANAAGIRLLGGSGHRIGGNSIAERNVVAGNTGNEISIEAGVDGAEVLGNHIGVDASGSAALASGGSGVLVVGSNVAVAFNVIAGNATGGIGIGGATAAQVVVAGNRIGLDATGTVVLGNGANGVSVTAGTDIAIGGLQAGFGNFIAGSATSNVNVSSTGNTVVAGNYIGTNAAGTAAASPGASGINISGRNVQVLSNLVSGNGSNGIVLFGPQVADVVIAGNQVGTNAAGTATVPNGSIGIRVINGTNLRIGGPAAADRNVISGNTSSGLTLEGGVDGALVQGNYIGTNLAGTGALSTASGGVDIGGRNITLRGNVVSGNANGGIGINGTVDNVVLAGNLVGTNAAGTAALPNGSIGIRAISGTNLVIGGSAPADRNVVSGNTLRNITLEGGVDGAQVLGNYIGTNATGTASLSANSSGIDIGGRNITVHGNTISGNSSSGINVSGSQVDGVVITGNRIGTNPAGDAAVANGSYGIRAITGNNVRIGGTAAGEGNVISGNNRGVAIEQGMANVVLQGNTIGLNAARTQKLPNGTWNGLDVSAPGTVVGGSAAGAGNVIAGNQGSGIQVQGETAAGSRIQGNFIGTNAAGAAGLGNRLAGIRILRSHAVQVGGTAPGEGNLIAWNEFNGILASSGDGNGFMGNRLRDNALLAIDLEPQGPQANDALDGDGGPNFLQNFPVLTSALAAGGSITVSGRLQGKPATTYVVEVVHSSACDPSGLGEGATPLGFLSVATDAAGEATFNGSFASAAGSGVVAALATAPDGSTSEFSPCHALTGPNPGTLQFWRNPLLTWEGLPYVEATVVRSGGNAGAVTVQLSTQNDSAIAPADYTATTTTVQFADGEVLKTVQIPVVADNLTENQEQFIVRLTNPTGGATLGAQAQVPAIVIDVGPEFPMYWIDSVTLDEPANGTRTATFTVNLTPTTVPHTISYQTSNGTAQAGSDYVAATGTLDFPASTAVQTRTLTVTLLADAVQEDDEVFYVNLSAQGNIAVFNGTGIGTIRQFVEPPSDVMFADGFE